ncbi:MAG: RNA polymerase sigma factor [Geminicoccaceae bacterium]
MTKSGAVSARLVPATGSGQRSPEEDDTFLLRRIAAGDGDAFENLYRRYYKRVFGFVLRMTSRMELAEEVVDDTMLTVWRRAADFRGASRPSTWIFGIAYRKALKAAMRTGAGQNAVELDETNHEPVSSGVEAMILRDQIAKALDRLPTKERAIVELTYLHGYKYTEIAEIADCPVGTVKTRMRSARAKLRQILTGFAKHEEGRGDDDG